MPCPGPFHFSHSIDYIYDFCSLPDPDVGLSILLCDVEHTSFHFGLNITAGNVTFRAGVPQVPICSVDYTFLVGPTGNHV